MGVSSAIAAVSIGTFTNYRTLDDFAIPAGMSGVGFTTFIGYVNLERVLIRRNGARCMSISNILFADSLGALMTCPINDSGARCAIPSRARRVRHCTFSRKAGLGRIVLGSNLLAVNSRTFLKYASVADVGIPRNIAFVNNNIFRSYRGLSSMSLPAALQRYNRCIFLSATLCRGGAG